MTDSISMFGVLVLESHTGRSGTKKRTSRGPGQRRATLDTRARTRQPVWKLTCWTTLRTATATTYTVPRGLRWLSEISLMIRESCL
ncbi:hypothetical protein JMJ77_0008062 [Colletotrichum scovillei]|uniref:Uncharacterized protein n=1 Tax=Colletotrichum scovillei TaxID=1209932 RepID=A0A9P7RDG0_9PEZI|nr:hypothetical protein JMJ77_0008062 [Colletotrichum scovillei]KAG7075083.1 hypothetical protein JMJ76_0011546 [Colletotrichum scovillei]KAG7082116.1 hypothetical protein JMJ78_0004221 [Colletotrichum scovillei]